MVSSVDPCSGLWWEKLLHALLYWREVASGAGGATELHLYGFRLHCQGVHRETPTVESG